MKKNGLRRRPTKKARQIIKTVLFGRQKPTPEQSRAVDKAIDNAYRFSNPETKETKKARQLPTNKGIKGTLRIVRRGRRRLITFQPFRKP